MAESKKALWRAGEIQPALRPFTQKLNPNSLFRAAGLSRLAGMSRAHVSLVKLPPGKDSLASPIMRTCSKRNGSTSSPVARSH